MTTEHQENEKNQPIIDIKLLANFSSADKKQILELFLTSSSGNIERIKQGKLSNNLENILLDLHNLKGTTAIIGAEVLKLYVTAVEKFLKDIRNSDFKIIPDNLPETENEKWLERLVVLHQQLIKEIEEIKHNI